MVWDFIFMLALPIIYLSVDSYVTLEITLLLSYCLFMLVKKRPLSIWSFLIVILGTFTLRIAVYYFPILHYGPFYYMNYEFVAEALTEVPYCLAEFLLIWGTLFIVRKMLNQKDYFVQRRNLKAVIYLIVLVFFFYFHFAYEYLQGKPYIYRKIYNFWLSVIPKF